MLTKSPFDLRPAEQIKWTDNEGKNWSPLAQVMDEEPPPDGYIVFSIGWVIHEDDEQVVLATNVAVAVKDCDDEPMMQAIAGLRSLYIPKESILDRRPIGHAKDSVWDFAAA